MKHIAVRATSVRKIAPFTTPGLGDRLHTCLLAYNYSVANNRPVTLHISDDKWHWAKGTMNEIKIKSWKEILELLPPGHVYIHPHEIHEPKSEKIWMDYLKAKGIDAEQYHYGDFTGRYESTDSIEISQYLKTFPQIKPIVSDLELPEKFVTAQFDSNNVPYNIDAPQDSRKISPIKVMSILNRYRDNGYKILFVGGDAEIPQLKILKYCGYAMSKAAFHIGADSGFFHLATMYMPKEKIVVYSKGGMSHHVARARLNKVKVELL